MPSDRELALEAHRYITRPDGPPAVSVTAISGLLDDGKSAAFAGAAVKLAREGLDFRAEWKASGARGTRIHGHCEAFLRGEDIDCLPEDMGYVDAVERFLVDWEPEVLELEFIVVSHLGYGGRSDMLIRPARGPYAGKTVLGDLKSGSAYGVEHTLQLAAYRFADGIAVYDEAGKMTGTRPLPEIDVAGCLYARQDGSYTFLEYPADERAFAVFAALLAAYGWTRTDPIKSAVKTAKGVTK